MAIERTWERQGPAAFTADGGENGLVTVSDVLCFKVKQKVVLTSDTQGDLPLQVKRVLSFTQLIVGPFRSKQKTGNTENNLKLRENISAFTLADNAMIHAVEQPKTKINPVDITQSTYEHEPTNAVRTIGVDKVGTPWGTNNPVPVTATFSGTVDIEAANRQVIQNITSPAVADTEFSFTLSNLAKKYQIRVRNDSAKGRIAFAAGETSSKFWTLTRGTIFKSADLDLPATPTIYMTLNKSSQVVEVITWFFV